MRRLTPTRPNGVLPQMIQPSALTRPDWIVFDLGAVLIDWNPRYVYRRVTKDEAKIETFLREVATSEWNSQLDAGTPFAAAIAKRIEEFPEWREWLEMWRVDWPTMLNGPIDDAVSIFMELVEQRKHGKIKGIFALSNWEANTIKIAKARFPFLQHFDGRLISGEERLIKPDPRFFQLLESRFGIVPERSFFIDDVMKNIETAKNLGFQTHHFVQAQALREDLERRSVF